MPPTWQNFTCRLVVLLSLAQIALVRPQQHPRQLAGLTLPHLLLVQTLHLQWDVVSPLPHLTVLVLVALTTTTWVTSRRSLLVVLVGPLQHLQRCIKLAFLAAQNLRQWKAAGEPELSDSCLD